MGFCEKNEIWKPKLSVIKMKTQTKIPWEELTYKSNGQYNKTSMPNINARNIFIQPTHL
jgi:hypothetical protein